MDPAKNNKVLMRARMKEAALKREKRIDSPLVRYNEIGQAVCKVCNVVIKSETMWAPHLASRSHKEAAEQLKARAAKPVQVAGTTESQAHVAAVPTKRSSHLPSDFFDSSTPSSTTKRLRPTGDETSTLTKDMFKVPREESRLGTRKNGAHEKTPPGRSGQGGGVSEESSAKVKDQTATEQVGKPSSLPEGFFDSVDADHRARGLEPPKLDMKDEWKEFQKSIRDDLHEVDYRQQEEEYEAAEEREEREQVEQRTFLERIEMFRKQKQQKASQAQAALAFPAFGAESDASASDDDGSDDENLFIDWRAKQISL